ncbi:MAG TPA: RNA polymerase sporulation sigma factor SigK [Clostridiales bacterium]|nr:RNA polymerase sporulation sigma factor SigK [Clostridiales bacterium]
MVVPGLAGAFPGAGFVSGYLAGGNAFPHPLAEEDERCFLQRLAQGDEVARNVLIERNLRLVAHIVKKFDNTGQDPEDLISIGTVGLIKGIANFDPEKGTRLATFCARCIENEILMHLRTLKRVRAEISLYDPIGIDREGNEMTFFDILRTEDDPVPDRVGADLDAQLLRARLAKLGRRERLILELRYGLESGVKRTQREIARLLGISRSYVSRLEKKALSKLCREWSGNC